MAAGLWCDSFGSSSSRPGGGSPGRASSRPCTPLWTGGFAPSADRACRNHAACMTSGGPGIGTRHRPSASNSRGKTANPERASASPRCAGDLHRRTPSPGRRQHRDGDREWRADRYHPPLRRVRLDTETAPPPVRRYPVQWSRREHGNTLSNQTLVFATARALVLTCIARCHNPVRALTTVALELVMPEDCRVERCRPRSGAMHADGLSIQTPSEGGAAGRGRSARSRRPNRTTPRPPLTRSQP